jgi:TolA-binding protein
VLCASLFTGGSLAYAGGEYEEAKLNAGDKARNLSVSAEVEALLRKKEQEVAERRKAGVKLIETYLREHPGTPEVGELLFQLAELKWEESKANFLSDMVRYNNAVDACQKEKEAGDKVKEEDKPEGPRLEGSAAGKNEPSKKRKHRDAGDRFEPVRCKTPDQPQLDLVSSQVIYKRIIDEHPRFPKMDAVLYLYGFSLRSQGQADEALAQFKRIIAEFPKSRFRPDAWMAVAEARFYSDSDYRGALAGYDEVLKFPDSPLYDLALFKTAWCYWKLGEPDKAARRFKEVLDLGSGATTSTVARADQLTDAGRKRLAELKNEALDYLTQIFTEDEKKGAKDAYEFLSSIGGAAYSRKVIVRLADTFYNQARYDRAIEAYRFLVQLDPADPDAAERQKQIALAYHEMDNNKAAAVELHKLADNYLDGSEWAKAQSKEQVRKTRDMVSALLRDQAKNLHADAQRVEMYQKKIDLERYGRAADAYAFYLAKFPDDPGAVEVSYLLGDIHFLKTRENEKAGDAYLFVGKSKPLGKLHKDALLNSITAYERVRAQVRPNGSTPGQQPLPTDKKMGEAIDLYATLFPTDPEIPSILYKNGELFYDAGEYDEAVKRFGLIVEKYPKHVAAQDAGNKILESLNKSKDYENVESWARRLLKVAAFQDRANQERLGKLVIDAGMKAGEQKADKDPVGAAAIYLRVQKEFPTSPRAPQALTNAATLYTRAGKPEESVKVYGILIDKYPSAKETPAAAWNAGKLYEAAALWDQAAKFYQVLADRYPADAKAPDALYNAGLLKEHLGDTAGAIAAYGDYARKHKEREDARKVAFRVGVVLGESGQHEAAARAFADFTKQYSSGADAIEALEREGEEMIKAGQDKRAEEPLRRAIASYRKNGPKGGTAANAAAHARYLEGEAIFRDFERVQLAKDARHLKKTLDEKSALLEKAKAAFVDVVTFNDPEWATAALYRIGEGYERFSKALRDAPTPPGLDEQSAQVYREELEKVVVVVEEKAIDAYRGGYKKAFDLGVYNEFTQKLRQALGRLSDQEFPPENEARARPSAADRGAAPAFVGSVDR